MLATITMATTVRQVKREKQRRSTIRLSQAGLGDVPLPGAASFHTHSAKFPIEREVILSSGDKNCKIPILTDYMRKAKPGVAPDAPSKQLAWQQQQHKPIESSSSQMNSMPHDLPVGHRIYKAEPLNLVDSSQGTEPSPIRSDPGQRNSSQDVIGVATSTPEASGVSGVRTYHSIKEMIAGRFEDSLSPQSQLRQHGVYLASTSVQDLRHVPPPPTAAQQHQSSSQQQLRQVYQQTPTLHQPDSYRRPLSYHITHQEGAIGGKPPDVSGGAIPRYQLRTPQLGPQYHHGHPPIHPNPAQQQSLYLQQKEGYEMTVYSTGPPHTQTPHHHLQTPLYTPRPSQSIYQSGGHHPPHQGPPLPQDDKQIYQQTPHPRTPLVQVRQHYHQQQPPLGQQLQAPMTNAGKPLQIEVDGNGGKVDPEAQEENTANIQNQHNQQQQIHHKVESETVKTKIDVTKGNQNEEDDDEGGFVKAGGQTDSGRGSTVYSSGKAKTSPEPVQVNGDTEWVDLVETELRNILRPEKGHSTLSDSISSVSPPLPPLSPAQSSEDLNYKRKSSMYNGKAMSNATWGPRTGGKERPSHHRGHGKQTSKAGHSIPTNGLEIDSMLDENNSSDDDLEYTDVQTIRKQLEGLENMYSQVLKLLGVNKKPAGRYEASDPRVHKRRVHGSISSLPSSVSSRPKRRETRNKVRDIKGINKRFQRLESHVVTLARSVAHLSSEMRTQHLMMQEMEVMRGELASLRVQAATRARLAPPSAPTAPNSTPEKVKKLTKFFGDEPPLLRIFLKKLGYEKYASLFEKERIGLVELPYLTEERLVRLGIPLGPRLRIMQQAQLAFTQVPNTLCIV